MPQGRLAFLIQALLVRLGMQDSNGIVARRPGLLELKGPWKGHTIPVQFAVCRPTPAAMIYILI